VDKVIGSFEEEGRMGMRRSREAGYRYTIPRILSLREVKVEHFYGFFFYLCFFSLWCYTFHNNIMLLFYSDFLSLNFLFYIIAFSIF